MTPEQARIAQARVAYLRTWGKPAPQAPPPVRVWPTVLSALMAVLGACAWWAVALVWAP